MVWSKLFSPLSFAKWSSALEICASKKLTFSTSSCLRRSRGESILRVVVLLEFDAAFAVSPSAGQVCGSLLLNCNCFGIRCAVLPGSCDLSLSCRSSWSSARFSARSKRFGDENDRRLEDIVRICRSKIPGIQIHPPIFLFLVFQLT